MTHREYLESTAAMGDDESIAELANLPELPRLGAHLWHAFAELAATRQSSGMAPSRLSRLEIHAWEADEGQRLERWERRAVMAIDAAWLKSVSEDLEASREKR